MNIDIIPALKELEREKAISFETILHGLEDALAAAYKSWKRGFGEEPDGARCVIDPETGDIEMYEQTFAPEPEEEEGAEPAAVTAEPAEPVQREVIDERRVQLSDDFIGRIAAQTAKHVIYQKLRDAERELTYEEFSGREGDIVTGIIQQDSHRYTLLDLGKVEALLPKAEQVPSEPYRHGERLKAYIVEVRRTSRGPQIVVSSTHPGLLKKLFEFEVPEIAEGIVEIKAVAREPGHRSKIAVTSNEPGVDPVGACVGAKGARVRMVVNELRGEKIDVVPWAEDPRQFVAAALQPAKVKEVRIDPDTQTAMVIVPDYQLSLAIGKEGQNARLAARLTGWRIDIKSEAQWQEEQQSRREAARPAQPAPETATEAASAPGAAATDGEGDASAVGGEPSEAPMRQCAAILSNGERCSNAAKPGSAYCGIPAHQKQGEPASA